MAGRPRGTVRSARLVLCFALFALPLFAKNGAFRSTAHGDMTKGPQRRAEAQTGSCAQCHDHRLSQSGAAANTEHGLFAPDDNDLCFFCHAGPSDDGVYPGRGEWSRSAHALSPQMVRGGSHARPTMDAGKCVNCHDPHGVKDSAGLIPAMLDTRATELCLSCHDGSRGADVNSAITRMPYRHGMSARGRHDPHEGGDPAKFGGIGGANRHVECSDCHDIHRSTTRRSNSAPEASPALQGVSRVQVANGAAGAAPNYTWRGADDPAVANEYEVCFKCHSSWTRLPVGKPDLALLTNPANASYHPIQAAGKSHIDRASFTFGYGEESIVGCTSCHGSDDPGVSGLHAAPYENLLPKPQPALCFQCHASGVYGDAKADAVTQHASRWNAPAGQGHAFHVGEKGISCEVCHDAHGSVRHRALLRTGRFPGLIAYVQTPLGGTCTTSCHAARSYTFNYPR